MRSAPAAADGEKAITPASFLPLARQLAWEAGKKVMELLKDPLVKTRKADHSIVTNADHAANDIIRSGLRRSFPAHALLSEETGLEGPEGAEYLWMVDPLDGTKAYARGTAGFSVMVGLMREGRPVLGVVYDPSEDCLFEAVRGLGCVQVYKNKAKGLHVSDRREWARMPLITSTGFSGPLLAQLTGKLPLSVLPPVNSVGVKVGYLARGLADIYVNHHPVHYWDTCAPLVILEEAGGVMTHWDGAPLSYKMDGLYRHAGPTLATNGPGHGELLKILSELKPA